ncbi:hypothetical protein CKM354_000244700 [Cercospora kikuchii]|uniref:Uncharacterized protein n=1 Tax=Cercospora kikuchii TaxID=84275 RepID=A0A9P3CFM9_9PEZI|nr:uncharacterized protein CKM354_000244700 [Cercospora kikuchii]GIZ39055.1 hypothetical protein CKM354_000244700 [Cercospora kikuchii]
MASAYEAVKGYFQEHYLTAATGGRAGRQEEIRTTPLFSLAVKYHVDHAEDEVETSSECDTSSDNGDASKSSGPASGSEESQSTSTKHSPTPLEPSTSQSTPLTTSPGEHQAVLPQSGLLGFHVGDTESVGENEPMMLNVNAPNSVFICGSQGSGKSYTLSTMLENCLMKDNIVSSVSQPVAGVVFHYDVDSSSSISEVAHLCSLGIEVNVLVSQSNEHALRKAYERIGTGDNKPKVRPLLLRSSDLSVDRMNKLMALAEKEGPPPLYMEVIQRILRRMAIENTSSTGFDYKRFRGLLEKETLSKDQWLPLNLRFSLLESFLHPNDIPARPLETWRPKSKKNYKPFDLKPGSLTIIDLSDPFTDAATACSLFDICLRLIKAQPPPLRPCHRLR